MMVSNPFFAISTVKSLAMLQILKNPPRSTCSLLGGELIGGELVGGELVGGELVGGICSDGEPSSEK